MKKRLISLSSLATIVLLKWGCLHSIKNENKTTFHLASLSDCGQTILLETFYRQKIVLNLLYLVTLSVKDCIVLVSCVSETVCGVESMCQKFVENCKTSPTVSDKSV